MGSKTIAGIMHIHGAEGLSERSIIKSADGGIYIGDEPKFKLPVFLNFESSINNHMFVVGMTGSGKSYFLKNLLMKMTLVYGYAALVIDFTGEYRELANFVLAENANAKSSLDSCTGDVAYADLSSMKEGERIKAAEEYLNHIIDACKWEENRKCRKFVVLDEAWKLLTVGGALGRLIREGRKYGIGVIMASQMLVDLDRTILENVATILAFRLQDKHSLNNLAKDYNLSQGTIKAIQNLEVGGCLVIRLGKNSRRSVIPVERIQGRGLPKLLKMQLSDGMDFQIDESKFALLLKNLDASSEAEGEISRDASENGVSLSVLIMKLIEGGADRRRILNGLREFGVPDREIADAFSTAVAEVRSDG